MVRAGHKGPPPFPAFFSGVNLLLLLLLVLAAAPCILLLLVAWYCTSGGFGFLKGDFHQ